MQEYCRILSFEAMYYAKFCFVGATGSSPVTLSGYGINKKKAFERIRALSQKYCLNLEEPSAIERYLNFYNNKCYRQRPKCMTPMEFHCAAA